MCKKFYFERNSYGSQKAVACSVDGLIVDYTSVYLNLKSRNIEIQTCRTEIYANNEGEELTDEQLIEKVKDVASMYRDECKAITLDRFKEIRKEATGLMKIFDKF